MFHYLGLALVLISWVAAYYFFKRWHDPNLRSISRHAASNKTAYIFFIVILVIVGSLFYVWLVGWFGPRLKLGTPFDVLISITIFCQVVTGLVPDRSGIKRSIHRTAAYTMAVLYFPLAVLILGSHQISSVGRAISILLLAYMLATFTAVVVLGMSKKRYLIYQTLYILAFQILILASGYLG